MNARELTCDRCSARFGCGVDEPTGCWCIAIPLNATSLTALRERFGDCLCKPCLLDIADKEKAGARDSRPA